MMRRKCSVPTSRLTAVHHAGVVEVRILLDLMFNVVDVITTRKTSSSLPAFITSYNESGNSKDGSEDAEDDREGV